MEPATPTPSESPKNTESLQVPAVEAPTPAASTPAPATTTQASTQPVPTAPAAPAPVVTNSAPVPDPVVATPAVADDVDVIEKEWVEATEQAVAKTAGDPHAKEEAIEDLQIDYLKKRYGKDIKKS